MFRHHFITAWRKTKKDKTTFLINLIGLSTSIACAMLIYLWIQNEYSIDRFHKKSDRLYQVLTNEHYTDGIKTTPETSGLLADALQNEIAGIESAVASTPTWWMDKMRLTVEDTNIKSTGKFVGSHFFNVFSYPLLSGNPEDVLADRHSIVLSESLSRRLFQSPQDALGKTILFQDEMEFQVAGVFKDIPTQSTDHFDFVIPFRTFQDMNPRFKVWNNIGPDTYIVLEEGSDKENVESILKDLLQTKQKDTRAELFLQLFKDKYLYGKYENGQVTGGKIEIIRMFTFISILILIVASINFINLVTAQATFKSKEVGIKKTLGVNRNTLIVQFLSESVFTACIAGILALLMVIFLVRPFNAAIGTNIEIPMEWEFLVKLGLLIMATGIVSGIYPAFFLSGIKPFTAIQGKINRMISEKMLRKSLVVTQFIITVILITGVLVIHRQLDFIESKDIGYDKDQIICFDLEGNALEKKETFLSAIRDIPGVENASTINSRLVGSYGSTGGVEWKGKSPDDQVSFEIIQVNYDMIETLGVEVSSGRSFSEARDQEDDTRILLNEEAVKTIGLMDPVGKKLELWGKTKEIIGVVKNFHTESFHETIKPTLIRLLPGHTDYAMVRIKQGNEKGVVNHLQDFYQDFNPGYTLDYHFLGDEFQTLYNSEYLMTKIGSFFALLAIIISCLGLFGLTTFATETRRKEIGIRKLLGSSLQNIVALLSGEFIWMILLSLAVAIPLAGYLAGNWLESFAFRTELSFWDFLFAAVIVLVIGGVTIGIQTIKAAYLNPIQTIRHE